jgi:hypothetical protein
VDPKKEAERLLEAGFPFAQEMLEEHGEFYPFGALINADDSLNMVAGHEEGAKIPAETVVKNLMLGFLAGASEKQFRVVAVFSNVTVGIGEGEETEESSAILAGIEHESGYCINVFLPYELKEDNNPTYGELIAAPREGAVFESVETADS